jgi:hypothetical protein
VEHDLFRKPVSTFRDHALIIQIEIVKFATGNLLLEKHIADRKRGVNAIVRRHLAYLAPNNENAGAPPPAIL